MRKTDCKKHAEKKKSKYMNHNAKIIRGDVTFVVKRAKQTKQKNTLKQK